MSILCDLKPELVFRYFEELCGIPHGSANTKQISDYCVEFAKQHGLKYIQDEYNNVIIFKAGTTGYEDSKPVIIQGHLDMVCEKENDCDINFETDGLRLAVSQDNFVYAEGTTLGADDGIAVAFALAILASDDIPHPPLEAVFTVDEETGMLGAAALDCSGLKADIMLNLDSEEEGYLLVSCAGGVTAVCHIPVSRVLSEGRKIRLRVKGLKGGHSGVEIDKGRGNANQILGRVLYALKQEITFEIMEISGGLKDNAIPREACADIVINDGEEVHVLQSVLKRWNEILANEYRLTDSGIQIEAEENGADVAKGIMVFDKKTRDAVVTALVNLPGGIQKMSRDIEGLVQTSLNLGILKTDDKEVTMSYSVRSSVQSEKEELVLRLKCLMDSLNGYVTCVGDYPAWEYKGDSRLRELMSMVYEEQYGSKPVIQAIHAGVECGLFAGKIEGLDCVSFGPNIFDIHTPKERLDVASVQRTWKYVLEILKRLK